MTAYLAALKVLSEATGGSCWVLNGKAYQMAHYARVAALATAPMNGETGGATFEGLTGEATHIHLLQGSKILIAAELPVPIKPNEGTVRVSPGWQIDTDGDKTLEAMAQRAEALGAMIREMFVNV